MTAPATRLLERPSDSPDLFPIVRGIGPTPIPRPERQYYWFGEFIGTTDVDSTDDGAVGHLRDRARTAIEQGIAFLLDEQRVDPRRSLLGRWRGRKTTPPAHG